MAKKLSDVLKEMFGMDFGNNLENLGKETSPVDFMNGQAFTKTEEEGFDDKTGEHYTKTTYVSKDGRRKFTRKTFNTSADPKRSADMGKRNRLYTLEMELMVAVENQEFEKAAKIRDEIAKLKEQLKKA